MSGATVNEDELIEFIYVFDNFDAVARPKPAEKFTPEWYDKLPFRDEERGDQKTVKTCIPFMEAMNAGWIVPTPTYITLEMEEDCRTLHIHDSGPDPVFHGFNIDQLGREAHPLMPRAILKWVVPWVIRTPKGYSTLFVGPLNRHEDRWQMFAGIVDTDQYFNRIEFPCVWTKPGWSGTIEANIPLVQAIPFKREVWGLDGRVREQTDREQVAHEKVMDAVEGSNSVYQNNWWASKPASRDLTDREE